MTTRFIVRYSDKGVHYFSDWTRETFQSSGVDLPMDLRGHGGICAAFAY